MKASDLVERVKKESCAENVANDVLYDALKRLEISIAKKADKEECEFDRDAELYACGGGVADGYDDMYSAYLKGEACRVREDWECYGNYDSIFVMRYVELCKEIIRNRPPKRYTFTQRG